jgi:hypothetical protein
MFGLSSTARAQGKRAARGRGFAGPAARLLLLAFCCAFACRERISLPRPPSGTSAGGVMAGGFGGAPARLNGAAGDAGLEHGGGEGGSSGASASEPALLEACPERPAPTSCRISGDSTHGVRLLGTLLEPRVTRLRGVLDIDEAGNIRCAACDCGDAGPALVIDCPGLVIAPGLINLHDH